MFDPNPFDPSRVEVVASCVARIATLALRGSVVAQREAAKLEKPLNCSCKVCCRSSIYSLAQTLLSRPAGTFSVEPSPSFVQSLHNGTYETDMKVTIAKMLIVLSKCYRMRETEAVQAVALFERILQLHWKCFAFTYLFQSSLKTVFLTCVVLAHKSSVDQPFTNALICQGFGIPLFTLNNFESSMLDLLSFNTTVDAATYKSLVKMDKYSNVSCPNT